MYAYDINCQNVQWVYRAKTSNKECLVELAANNNLMLLENPKVQPVSHLGAGTLEPIQTWPLRVPDQTTGSLACKFLHQLLDRHMVNMFTELFTNLSFTLTFVSGKRSRLQCLKNDIPQESVLAPFYVTSTPIDWSTSDSKKYN